MADRPEHVVKIRDFLLSDEMPDDASYIVVVQRDGDDVPTLLTNITDMVDVAKTFRDLAKRISGDA